MLPGDPVWLAESLAQYYPLLDALVIPVPEDGLGWSGAPIPVDECLAEIRRVDTRMIAREIPGRWVNVDHPIMADTAQRQAALEALVGSVDWVVQLDNDEFLPRPRLLMESIDRAAALSLDAVELPMRVLFRRTSSHVFEIAGAHGDLHHEYPGSVLVRPTVRLGNARQVNGRVLRLGAPEASGSIQLSRPPDDSETRVMELAAADAIVHNSWARSSREIRRKVASWGHAGDANFGLYYWLRWWPVPWIWWLIRDFHPFSRGLWPRLRRLPNAGSVADHPHL
ncbi:hypothetical protein [Micropruina glycogenica]|uniref:Glycosyltransferase 2-like domain-containing protein n=1 Tax=Micropruina glycogenica TaxID=75385 RepID=A0A2N9JC91_9ACTN|nr:hypothetical protein [Micropruina glycogenica]SPD85118.1 conserved protein of unknown function [Micropruina glycogenica]